MTRPLLRTVCRLERPVFAGPSECWGYWLPVAVAENPSRDEMRSPPESESGDALDLGSIEFDLTACLKMIHDGGVDGDDRRPHWRTQWVRSVREEADSRLRENSGGSCWGWL